ncbi:hypothetical protein BDZ85DRAFT_107541 [Elsinoe ampelina]|uniref:Uncharacterized protein n=1 Tax=Elsinoe ampelina TaxID=302913 RepID=A0A6A6GC67_9PEZI|nr:hypothetical protein BDZ85DRAFT_107541 [Elsinoe ampelina]
MGRVRGDRQKKPYNTNSVRATMSIPLVTCPIQFPHILSPISPIMQVNYADASTQTPAEWSTTSNPSVPPIDNVDSQSTLLSTITGHWETFKDVSTKSDAGESSHFHGGLKRHFSIWRRICSDRTDYGYSYCRNANQPQYYLTCTGSTSDGATHGPADQGVMEVLQLYGKGKAKADCECRLVDLLPLILKEERRVLRDGSTAVSAPVEVLEQEGVVHFSREPEGWCDVHFKSNGKARFWSGWHLFKYAQAIQRHEKCCACRCFGFVVDAGLPKEVDVEDNETEA